MPPSELSRRILPFNEVGRWAAIRFLRVPRRPVELAVKTKLHPTAVVVVGAGDAIEEDFV